MARGIYKALNIELGEETSVLLLIFQSVFLGVFYGTFDISAHALFLEVYKPEMIPNAYIISGIAGIIMTSIYSWFQGKIRFSVFVIVNLFIVAILTALMRFGFIVVKIEWQVFIVFVMMGPLNIIALLGFWGTVGRIFTLRQGKRLFGLIDTGQIVGIIVSSYAIPVLLSFQVATKDLLFISAISIVVALLFQLIITNRIQLERDTGQDQVQTKAETSFWSLFKDRYIVYMSGFVVLLVIVTFFVHYTFITITKNRYPGDIEFAAFLGYFTGTLMIFSIIIKTFVYSKLMKTFGLKVALVISPLLLLLFTIIAAFVGGFFGFTVAAASFTLFFLLLSISKLFAKSLQDSIVAPSMKVLYQSLDVKIRYNVQARIDGTINEISALSSGLILAGLGILSFFELIHFTYVLGFFLIAWTFISFRLYRAYQKSLNDSLAKFKQSEAETENVTTTDYLVQEYGSQSPLRIINAVRITEYLNFQNFKGAIGNLLKSASGLVRKFSLLKVHEHELIDSYRDIEDQLKNENIKENKQLAREILAYLKNSDKKAVDEKDLVRLTKSSDPNNRKLVARYIKNVKEFDHLPLLNTLLRDHDQKVRIMAIEAASKWKVSETAPVLIDYLDTSFYNYVFDALVEMGNEALESLDQAFYKSGINDLTLVRITRILGTIGTPEAQQLLLNRIGYHKREVALQALEGLRNSNYQSDEANIYRITEAVRSVIEILAWNLAAQHVIKENELGPYLEKAIHEEITSNYDQLYLLLSIAYDPKSIYHIRQNLESGTAEGIGFALELLDIFVAEELKPILFPILDDTTVVEKIRQLQVEFPIELLEPKDLLISIMNRDPNYLNTYTKACAIYSLDYNQDAQITMDLLAQIFNPDKVLSELAAWKTNQISPDKYNMVTKRLDPEIKSRMDETLKKVMSGNGKLILDSVFYLEKFKYFSQIQGDTLLYLGKRLTEKSIEKEEVFYLSGKNIPHIVAFVIEKNLKLFRDRKELGTIQTYDMVGTLPFLAVNDYELTVKAENKTNLYYIDLEELKEVMFDQDKLALAIYEWMNEKATQFQDWNEDDLNMVS